MTAGFARAYLAPKRGGRLHRVLCEEGPPEAVLVNGGPAASRIAWEEKEAREPLKPNPAKPRTNFVSRVARELEGAGSEAATKPENVAGQPVGDIESTGKDNLGLAEYEAREEVARQTLDALGQAAYGRLRYAGEAPSGPLSFRH